GADTTGGAQCQPTDDHADQSHQRGRARHESPGAHGVNTGGRLEIVSSGSRGAADTDCEGYTEKYRDKPVRHGFPPDLGVGPRLAGRPSSGLSTLVLPAGEALVLDKIDLPDPRHVVE